MTRYFYQKATIHSDGTVTKDEPVGPFYSYTELESAMDDVVGEGGCIEFDTWEDEE